MGRTPGFSPRGHTGRDASMLDFERRSTASESTAKSPSRISFFSS